MKDRFGLSEVEGEHFNRFASSILELATDAVVAVNQDSRILFFNPAAETLFGYDHREVMGQSLNQLVDGAAAPVHEQYVREFVEASHDVRTMASRQEVYGRRKDGSRFPAKAAIMKIDLGDQLVLAAVVHDLTERYRLEEQLRQRAYYDALTGLPNRCYFQERLAHAIDRSARTGHCLAVLFLDLNGFKAVNDEFGHETGDLVLAEVGKRFAGTVRSEDTVARMGGDEFLVLLEGLTAETELQQYAVERAAARIAEALEAPIRVEGHDFPISVSVGESIYPRDGQDADSLIRHADLNMYHVKGGVQSAAQIPSLSEARRARR